MTGADDDWVKAAMNDDTMVADLLMKLSRSAPPPQPPAPQCRRLTLNWSVRQRRSKPAAVNGSKKSAHVGSPNTPLTWSGGAATSHSGGSGGGYEESKLLFNSKRSKVNGDGEKSVSKKPRKKKNLAELKEEENLLIKERRELKREISALRMNVEEQRATNEILKRRKLELLHRETIPEPEETISGLQSSTSNDNLKQNTFVLPDLNIPFDDVPASDVTCGVS